MASAAPLGDGSMLGRYRVEREVGQGGMGTVYRAYDTQLRRPVALKVLPPGHSEDPHWRRRLLHEARAASALNHPNIIAVYEVGSEAGVDFIAMEFVEGQPLNRLIPPKGLPVAQALAYAAQIADGLVKAHAAGVIHRDLKPGNIMVTGDGLVKLLDFGLARQAIAGDEESTLTMTRGAAGTPSYMSPEQAQGQEVDTRSDIFSFGSVLYEMLSGSRAFGGNTAIARLEAVLRDDPPPLAGLPPELEKLVARCLRKDPARRVQHIEDVRLVLRDLKEESDSGKLPVAAPAALPAWRNWILPGAALLLAMGAAGFWWFLRSAPPPASLPMERVTFDPGLATFPSISADGKLLAFASDRDGLFNIYVQQLRGVHAVRLTHNQTDNTQPSFSPDGSKIAFCSGHGGGGIYVVDALGGPERKVANEGRLPRFSPDGSTIAFVVTAPLSRTGALFLVDSNGGAPRPFQPGMTLPAVGPGHSPPLWSPDGRFLLFDAVRGGDPASRGWWVAPVAGGEAYRVHAPPMALRSVIRYTEAWRGNYIYFSEGTTVGGVSLYRVAISPKPWRIAGPPERLTSAAGMQMWGSISADGQLVFSSMIPNAGISSVALKANEATTSGPVQQMALDSSSKVAIATSANGSRLAYVAALFADRERGAEIRIRDLATGREDLIIPFSRLPAGLRLSPDGSRLAYRDYPEGKRTTFVTDPGAISAHAVCDASCFVLDFFANGEDLLVANKNQLVRQNVATGRRETLLTTDRGTAFEGAVSPDARWLAFTVERPNGTAALYAAPIRTQPPPPEAWNLIAEERDALTTPKWSPNGRWLYFGSKRDGFPCVWAQRMAADGKPLGSPLPVFHSHGSGGMKQWGITVYGITPDRLYMMTIELKGNIWTLNVGSR